MAVLWSALSLFHSLCCTPTDSTDINHIILLLAPSCHKFHQLGRGLNLEGSVMELILHEARRSSPYDSLSQVLTKWLTWNYPYQTLGKPSLSLLVKAVDTYDHQLAVKVFETFTSKAGEPKFACLGMYCVKWVVV